MTRIYLAGPWFTEKADILERYAAHVHELSNGNTYLFRPRIMAKSNPCDTFNSNITELNICDVVIALVSEKDIGTAFEIGYAKAIGKPIILVGFNESDFERKTNLMLAYAGQCCITIDKLHKVFANTLSANDCLDITRNWGNIE